MLESQYGKKGAAAFAVFRRGEADLEVYAKRFNQYYRAGKIGLSFDQIPAELIAESPHLAKVAFDAGVRDAKEKTLSGFTSTKSMGYTGKITEANGLPEDSLKPGMSKKELLNYPESHENPYDDDKVKSSLKGISKAPSQIAQSWQGSGKYPGVDKYKNITIKTDKIIYRGEPNGTGYFTTKSAIERSERDAMTIFEGLQVEKNAIHGYRETMQGYQATVDINAAFGIAKSNPQFGNGGLPQIFIPNIDELISKGYLIPVDSIPLNK